MQTNSRTVSSNLKRTNWVNTQDVENAVWHLLCAARISNVEEGRGKLIPISEDRRVPMSQIYEMYAGRMTPEQVLAIANRTSPSVQLDSEQHRLQRYYAHLYIGLYFEMLKNQEASIQAMKKSSTTQPAWQNQFHGTGCSGAPATTSKRIKINLVVKH